MNDHCNPIQMQVRSCIPTKALYACWVDLKSADDFVVRHVLWSCMGSRVTTHEATIDLGTSQKQRMLQKHVGNMPYKPKGAEASSRSRPYVMHTQPTAVYGKQVLRT
jgi:hypothetical protein